MLSAPRKRHARRPTVSQPLADRFPGRRIALPSNEAARLEPEGSCRTPAPVRRNKRAVHLPPSDSKRCGQSVSHADLRSKCQSADLWEIMIKIGPGTVDRSVL